MRNSQSRLPKLSRTSAASAADKRPPSHSFINRMRCAHRRSLIAMARRLANDDVAEITARGELARLAAVMQLAGDIDGAWSGSVNLSLLPGFAGTTVPVQAGALDFATASGLTFSNGLRSTVQLWQQTPPAFA